MSNKHYIRIEDILSVTPTQYKDEFPRNGVHEGYYVTPVDDDLYYKYVQYSLYDNNNHIISDDSLLLDGKVRIVERGSLSHINLISLHNNRIKFEPLDSKGEYLCKQYRYH